MKLHPTISAKLAVLQPNQVGLLSWSLLAHPLPMQAGGVPHQPTRSPRNRPSRVKRNRSSQANRPCLTRRLPRLWRDQTRSAQTSPAPVTNTRVRAPGMTVEPPVNSPKAGSRLSWASSRKHGRRRRCRALPRST